MIARDNSYWESGHYKIVDEINSLPTEIKEYQQAEEDLVKSLIIPRSDILEVGSGTGRILRLLQNGANRIVGLDHAVQMIEESRRAVSDKAELVNENAIKMPFSDDSFDYVLCLFNTFGNFSGDLTEYLREMKRVTRENGQLFLSVYSENALDSQLELYQRIGLTVDRIEADKVTLREGFHSRRFTEDALRTMFSGENLEVEITKLTPISYFTIGRK